MTIYANHTDLCNAICDHMAGMSADAIRTERDTKGTALNYLMRVYNRYSAALAYAERYTDLVGVGVISFAQARTLEFQRRAMLRGSPIGYKQGARDAWAGKPRNPVGGSAYQEAYTQHA